jgi:transcriptional regulator with XRE-family HTH domain
MAESLFCWTRHRPIAKLGVRYWAAFWSTGYHRNYIGQLERGEKSPFLAALFASAKANGMPPSAVLKIMEKLLGVS